MFGAMSHSRQKMRVVKTRHTPAEWNGKSWARVDLLKSRTFWPSFEDLHRIIQAICECEDEKYPNGKGRQLVAEFLVSACWVREWDTLAKQYKIPNRCGEQGLEKKAGISPALDPIDDPEYW